MKTVPNRILFLLIPCLSVTTLWAQVNSAEVPAYKFVKNEGQWDQNILYKANINSGALFMEQTQLTYHFIDRSDFTKDHATNNEPDPNAEIRGHAFTVSFEGATGSHQVFGSDQTTEYFNFFKGNDPSKWASEVYGYKHITYKNIYPGIDYQIYTSDLALKYDFTLDAGTDPTIIGLRYAGVDDISIKGGELIVRTVVGEIIEQKPYAYQVIDGEKVEVTCKFQEKDGLVTFKFPNGWNERYALVIDPSLIFASYSGSTADNFGMTATYDLDGNFFSAGTVFDIGYPTTIGAYDSTSNPLDTRYGVTDVFVTRYDSLGATLVYSTYLGGGTDSVGTETAHSLIVNDNNELLIFGVTSSEDFPMVNAYDNTFNGGNMLGFYYNGAYFYDNGTDLYVTHFSEDGTTLLGSTYVGGSDNDGVNSNQGTYTPGVPIYNSAYDSLQYNYGDTFRGEIMLDSNGDVLIASNTKSDDFPIIGGFQGTLNGDQDAVVFKLSGDLSTLMWSTYMGGTDKDAAYSVKVDSADVVYVAGGTVSNDFPIVGATYDTGFNGGKADGYIAKISADGSTLLRSTFLGTNQYDQCFFVEVDNYAAVYVVGQTAGPASFPIVNVAYSNPNSGHFVSKFSTDLATMTYSTQFGNSSGGVIVSPAAFLVDLCQNVYVSGWGANILTGGLMSGMPLTSDAVQSTTDGNDFYLIVFERDIDTILYGSYFGGNISHEHVDGGTSRFNKEGVVYQSVCAGCGGNSDFPTTTGAWSNLNLSTNCNNGTFKYDFGIVPVAQFDIDTLWGCAPFTVTLTNNSSLTNNIYEWEFGNGDSTTTIFSPTVTYTDTGTYIVSLIITDTICQISDTARKVVTVFPELALQLSNDTSLCVSAPIDLVATSNGSSLTYVWSTNSSFTDTLNSPITDSIFTLTPTTPGYYYCLVENPWCSIVDSVLVSFVPVNIYVPDTTLCNGFGGTISLVNYYAEDSILTYDWTPDAEIISGDGTNTISVSPSSNTTYYVTVTTESGCVYTDSSVVSVILGGGTISAWADADTIAINSSTLLHAIPDSSGYIYSWEVIYPTVTTAYLDDPTIANPTLTPPGPGVYGVCVTIEDTNGCSATACLEVRVVEMLCDDPDLYVPNAFTPNGDNQNDLVFVRGNNIEEMNFEIYDRWGELMFQTDKQTEGWDGIYNGMLADPAVFVYHLKGTCVGGDEFLLKGNITLIR